MGSHQTCFEKQERQVYMQSIWCARVNGPRGACMARLEVVVAV